MLKAESFNFIKQKLLDLKKELEYNTVIVGNFKYTTVTNRQNIQTKTKPPGG